MFPGFVSIYKDKDNYVNLYFYPGYTDANFEIYRPIELTNEYEYVKNINDDNSIIYKFINKKIKKIKCKLISFDDEIKNVILNI